MSGQRTPEKKNLEAEASLARKELKRKRIAILFIQCAEQLLREDGINNLSIRKLADTTGYSSATLYSYFEDLDELILYASFKYRREYDLLRTVPANLPDFQRILLPGPKNLHEYVFWKAQQSDQDGDERVLSSVSGGICRSHRSDPYFIAAGLVD